VASIGRRRTTPLRGVVVCLLPPPQAITLVVDVFELTMKPDMIVALPKALLVQLLALAFWLGSREAGIDVLGNEL
jgi:hypothetical protein